MLEFIQSVAGLITAIAALIGAIAALIKALKEWRESNTTHPKSKTMDRGDVSTATRDVSMYSGLFAVLLTISLGIFFLRDYYPEMRPATAAPEPTPVIEGGPYVIFSDALASGWDNSSWDARTSLTATDYVHSGSYAISVQPNRFGGLALRTPNGLNTQGYDHLQFFVNGGMTGGQKLKVFVNDNCYNGTRNPVTLDDTLLENKIVSPRKWQLVNVPLTALDAANITVCKINISDISGTAQPTFYVDDIRLVSTAVPARWRS